MTDNSNIKINIQCKAAIANGKGSFTIEDIEIAAPKADEVIVKMKAASLCHTDYDSLSWRKPIVMGHEGAGEVFQLGASVSNLAVGDRVVLNWATPCGQCFQCKAENEHLCEINSPVVAGGNGYTPGHAHLEGTKWNKEAIERSFNLGTLSTYALVKSSAITKIDCEGLAYASASLLSCGVMTGWGSVYNATSIGKGDSVVVIGTGGVGLNVIQAARMKKANPIIAIDINEDRLKMAMEFGATTSILASTSDKDLLQAAEKVKSLTAGRGADYAFECTAIPALGAAPLAMVRNAGTAVQVSGIEQEIVVDMNLFEWDKNYINPLYGQCNPQRDFPLMIEQYKSGELLLDELVSKTYSLDNLQLAFDDMLAGRVAKGVIIF